MIINVIYILFCIFSIHMEIDIVRDYTADTHLLLLKSPHSIYIKEVVVYSLFERLASFNRWNRHEIVYEIPKVRVIIIRGKIVKNNAVYYKFWFRIIK